MKSVNVELPTSNINEAYRLKKLIFVGAYIPAIIGITFFKDKSILSKETIFIITCYTPIYEGLQGNGILFQNRINTVKDGSPMYGAIDIFKKNECLSKIFFSIRPIYYPR